ncbi:Mediator of RNA polymerase II transcription subunit 31 [Linum perenne]
MASSKETENVSAAPSSPKKVYKDPDDGKQRFLLELEFVQCLANPTYIHYLAQNRYFEDEAFIGYLKYLQYWQRPEYIKFIMYPHCLFFLELLQNVNFRNAMAHPGNKELAHRQQFYYWKNYRNNRLKHILPRPLPEPAAATPVSAPPLPPPPTAMPTGHGSTMSLPTHPPSSTHSPMPYGMNPGSAIGRNEMRNAGMDRRKRKDSEKGKIDRLAAPRQIQSFLTVIFSSIERNSRIRKMTVLKRYVLRLFISLKYITANVVDRNNGRIVATASTVEHSIKNSLECGRSCNAKAATVVGEVLAMRLKVEGLEHGLGRGIHTNVTKEIEKKGFKSSTKVWAIVNGLRNNGVKLILDDDNSESES